VNPALWLILGLWGASPAPGATEVSPGAKGERLGDYERSICAELERICTTEDKEPGSVHCDRPAFARSLLGCVDLWQSDSLCSEQLASTRSMQSVDLEGYLGQLDRAAQELGDARRRTWVWAVVGVVGWGLAVSLLVGMAAK
jgi:hypothetical protein